MVSNTATKVDGRAGRLLEYSAIYEGERVWVLEAVAMRRKQSFFIGYVGPAELTDADRTAFESFLSTVDLDPAKASVSDGAGSDAGSPGAPT